MNWGGVKLADLVALIGESHSEDQATGQFVNAKN
jgi:hypothetical protein